MNGSLHSSVIQKGHILLDQGRYKDAVLVFKDGLSNNPQDPVLLYYLALAQYHIKEYQKQSLETINEALKIQNDDPVVFELKALILGALDKNKEALEMIDQALALDAQSAQAHATKGYLFSLQEKWAKAEEHARVALALDADSAFAGNVLASALRMQNKLDEGVHLASDMLAKDPDDNLSHSNMGWVYLHKKQYDKAQMHFKESLRLDPNFEPARTGMLETYKAKSPLYRLYLQYALFMARQTQAIRIAIIVGIYLTGRVVSKNFNAIFQGPMALVGYAILIVIYFFFFWSWLAGGVGNLLIFSDKMARCALNRSERMDAIFVGGGFFTGVLLVLLGAIIKVIFIKMIGMTLILTTIPMSVSFVNRNDRGRIFYGTIAVLLFLSGLTTAFAVLFYGNDMPSGIKIIPVLAFVLFIVSSWMASFGCLRK